MISVDFQRHQHAHDKLVRQAIKAVGLNLQLTYQDSLRLFRDGDVPVTFHFWEEINATHPGFFVGVSYCMGCRKFNLEFA